MIAKDCYVEVLPATTVADVDKKMTIRLFPNPSHDVIYFDPPIQDESCRIFSMDGRIINEMRIQQNYMNVSMLDEGIYNLDLKYSSNRIRFVKF